MSTDAHDDMVKAFIEYFKHNERFEYKKGHGDEPGAKARFWLSEIRRLARIRRAEIQDKRQKRRIAKKGKLGRPPKVTKMHGANTESDE